MRHSRTRMDVYRVENSIAREQILLGNLRRISSKWPVLFIALLLCTFNALGDSNETSVVELQRELFKQTNVIRSFQLEGVVCATVAERRLLALQDKTGTLLLELPSVDAGIHVGDRVAIDGKNCLLKRNRFGVRVCAPVVDNDGLHSALLQSNCVFLNGGFQPIHMEWFNCLYESALRLEYSGPGVPRQSVPGTALWRKPPAGALPGDFQPGLDYAAYDGNWTELPDFGEFDPVARGVATNFSLSYSTRDQYAGLVFDGFIKIDQPGNYTFYLTSDDGSRLEVGRPQLSCTVLNQFTRTVSASKTFDQAQASREYHSWVELEGKVEFVAEHQRSMEMELVERGIPVPVTVVEDGGLSSTNLLNQHIRVEGICEFSPSAPERELVGLFVPSAAQVQILPAPAAVTRGYSSSNLLTTCAEIRRLKPEEAAMGIPTKVTGVVIAADPLLSVVLEDSSGGVFVHLNWTLLFPHSTNSDTVHTNYSTGFFVHATPPPGIWFTPLQPDGSTAPAVGQVWEIEGRTDPGDFSPIIFASNATFHGQVALPKPIQPTWDQLMNGSLDAEYVEIHGVMVSISTNEMTLLLPNGKVTIEGGSGPLGNGRPLPEFPGLAPESLIGSVVRIRGCFTADWDFQTRQVIPGRFFLAPAVAEIEEPAPSDPFSLTPSKASDLLSFNARASALQRVKVAGQIIHVRSGEYFMLEGQTGIRALTVTDQSELLRPGDLVEAAGFLRQGGPSPVLQEAQIRKIGRAPLPEPVTVSVTNMLARGHDSTLVRVEGILINAAVHQGERILELQNGAYHFAAVQKSRPATWRDYSIGSRLQLTGVYASENPGLSETTLYPFEILLNSSSGIVLLQRPAWWTVRSALTVATVLAGILGIAFIWITLLQRKVEQRTKQLEKEIETRQLAEQHRLMEHERFRVAHDLHDELGAGLTEVGILGALAKNPAVQPDERERYLSQLTESAGSLVTSLDEIVWAINPQYDSLASLGGYYSLFAQRFLNLAGIACRLRVSETLSEHPLNSKLRHGIFLAFKEALNNVVRHSGATEVEIKIELVDSELFISIRDNGKGLAADPAPGNDGLGGMRERLRQFGGECRIASDPGRGTLVEFRLNVNGAPA